MSGMNPIAAIVNAARRMETMFPGYFPTAKHNHYRDFGWPDTLSFEQLYAMYTRNGLARAGVDKTALKTWQDFPFLLEKEEEHKETTVETDIRQRFADLRIWQKLAEADRRSMVGGYAGAILRFADSKRFAEPVESVSGGLLGLVEVIPAWAGQLTVGEWDTDETSENYGHPKMFQFNEASVGNVQGTSRAFQLHPDRVVIWSKDSTVHARSILEPGYNDLMTMEKVSGAGGEGFWKNAKSSPVLNVDKESNLSTIARGLGVPESEIADKMDEVVADWQKGFDQLLMLQGIEAKTLGVTLPSPEHFFDIARQVFAASIGIPVKILVGSQTGERASTEDANEWAQTNMARRSDSVIPSILAFVNRLERVNILPERDWFVDWSDLTEPTKAEKIDRANKMADTNQKMKDTGELVFTPEEIRASVDLEPLSDAEKYRDDEGDDDAKAALTPPAEQVE